jgi:carbon monoxide dehydrogenase subunit G
MAAFSHAVSVPVPPAEVFPWLLDVDKVPRWVEGVESYEVAGDGPVGPGSRLRQTVTVSGLTLTMELEVVEYDPPRSATTRSELRGIAAESVYRVEPEGEGSRVTQTVALDPKGMSAKLLAPMVRSHLDAKLSADLARLRDALS